MHVFQNVMLKSDFSQAAKCKLPFPECDIIIVILTASASCYILLLIEQPNQFFLG